MATPPSSITRIAKAGIFLETEFTTETRWIAPRSSRISKNSGAAGRPISFFTRARSGGSFIITNSPTTWRTHGSGAARSVVRGEALCGSAARVGEQGSGRIRGLFLQLLDVAGPAGPLPGGSVR